MPGERAVGQRVQQGRRLGGGNGPGVLDEQRGGQWPSLGKCLPKPPLGLVPPGFGGRDNRR